MTLFPMRHPRLGLSVTTDSAYLVEIQRNWRVGGVRKLAQQPLPSSLIQLSPGKPNVSDPKGLSDALEVLSKGYTKPQPIVLSLPDICGRTALFEFTSFPKKPADREAILSWRFQQDLNLSIKNARLGFRLYEPQSAKKKTGTPQGPGVSRVLATTVQHSIIEQYEMACLRAGLLPLGVGLSSLDVFDLCRSMIQEATRTASQRGNMSSRELFFLYLAGWGFSFIALREDCPVFVRVKSLRLHRVQDSPPTSEEPLVGYNDPNTHTEFPQPPDTVQPPSGPTSQAERFSKAEMTTLVTNELVATLQYYFESVHSSTRDNKTLPLFVAEGTEMGTTFLPEVQEVETILKSSMVDPPPLALIPLADLLRKSLPKSSSHHLPHTPQRALPAYASVMVSS